MIHENSMKSWAVFPEGTRRNLVVRAIRDADRPMTDREVVYALGSKEMNYARPVITGLIHRGVLVEDGVTRCDYTGRLVRLVRIATEDEHLASFGGDRKSYSAKWTLMCEWAGLDRDATTPEDVVRSIKAVRNAASEMKRVVGASPLFISPVAHVLNAVLLPNVLEGSTDD